MEHITWHVKLAELFGHAFKGKETTSLCGEKDREKGSWSAPTKLKYKCDKCLAEENKQASNTMWDYVQSYWNPGS